MSESIPSSLPHPFADIIGFEVTDRSAGECTTMLEINKDHMNPHGVVHGAVIYALADTGMGGALTSLLGEDQICSTIEIKINYFRPALAGSLKCETEVVNKGSRTATLQSRVFDGNDKLISQAQGTFMILSRPD